MAAEKRAPKAGRLTRSKQQAIANVQARAAAPHLARQERAARGDPPKPLPPPAPAKKAKQPRPEPPPGKAAGMPKGRAVREQRKFANAPKPAAPPPTVIEEAPATVVDAGPAAPPPPPEISAVDVAAPPPTEEPTSEPTSDAPAQETDDGR